MKTTFLTLLVASLFLACSKDDKPQSTTSDFSYSNGNLGTGTTASDNTVAPAGYNWSQSFTGNNNTGYTANFNDSYSIADDFVIPANEKWNITQVSFYAYKTFHTAAATPFDGVYFEIYNGNPSTGGTKIFGDLTTNRFASSTDAKLYRITQLSVNTDRRIYKINASVSGLELSAGTYWIRWKTKTIDNSSHYHPACVVAGSTGLPTFNAINYNGTSWNAIKESPSNSTVDFPFEVSGVKTVTN